MIMTIMTIMKMEFMNRWPQVEQDSVCMHEFLFTHFLKILILKFTKPNILVHVLREKHLEADDSIFVYFYE